MINIIMRVARLFLGLFLFATGIVMTINANLGLSPWDVYHQGLSKNIHITMGQASISMGFIIVLLNYMQGERIGWGTVSNMLFVGMFMDVLMLNHLIPSYDNIILKLIMLIGGMFVIGFATFLYLGSGFGSGPRDGLMLALSKRTKKPIGIIRNLIEITVLIIGFFLGGTVGVGTVITAGTIGFCVQLVFKLLKFDAKKVKHRYIDEDFKLLKGIIFKGSKDIEKSYSDIA
jgi:uncharacterized membrane protein YczE